jgi:hypothetical protein
MNINPLAAVKSMGFNSIRQRPIGQVMDPLRSAYKSGFEGGNYGAEISGKPRLNAYFGGSLIRTTPK